MEKDEPRKTCVYLAEAISNASHGIGFAKETRSRRRNESQQRMFSDIISSVGSYPAKKQA
jgi:hypothetical protein